MRFYTVILLSFSLLIASCSLMPKKKTASSTTGWDYNNPKNGGFEYNADYSQSAGPGLVYVQGGTFPMGRVEQDVIFENNNTPRRVTVASFYMDETEVRNVDWREYLYWLQRAYPSNPEVYRAALPDTLVWRNEMAYNEPFLENYLRHAAYSEYPVVGVSWIQATNYCKWRTDRVNERILINDKILAEDTKQSGQNVFTSDSYLNGLYNGTDGKRPLKNLGKDGATRRTSMSDGIVLPRYRLPTEAEWEYAAVALVGNLDEEVITDRRIYPWNGNQIRSTEKNERGQFMANSVRGRGDYMGVAGSLNDGFEITAPVKSFQPNDLGLYCMAGNVNEWVQDVYRPTSFQEFNEFQPLRGSVYTNFRKDSAGNFSRNDLGEMIKDTVANFTNFKDGDTQSNIDAEIWRDSTKSKNSSDLMYTDLKGDFKSRISDHSRVYKGGSWKDRPYWLSPGTRRYLDERKSTNDIGFRCAMTKLGDAEPK
ncbi:MAG: SUMF1/EgtB/PvdO family nonheme iron enzyme [Bacteroidetes bacterium]|nr:SUMF1/EgtB/PvdO family nonheme iron enzyme [Bacteroidota bacterium]